MARIPNPPDLGQNQSFFGWLLEQIIRLVLGTWLLCQAIGFIFWSIWNLSAHGFREFMFRGYIDLWQNHSWRLPDWVGYIPTWQTPWIWVALILFIIWWNRRRIKTPSRSTPDFSDPKRSRGSAYDDADYEDYSDREFRFNWQKWGKQNDEPITDPAHLLETFKPLDDVEKAARAKANDPATSEAERQNIFNIIEKRRNKKAKDKGGSK